MRTPVTPSYLVATNLMNMIKQQVTLANVDTLGLKVLSQPIMWTNSDRSTVRNTFDNLLFQSLDLLGLPRFILPVEYVAAGIVSFVHPVNYFTACLWSESHGSTTDELSLDGEYDRFSGRQLFAVVCNVFANHPGVGPGTFESVMDSRIAQTLEPIKEPALEEEDNVNPNK